jgi:PIN domain nuclease of toxin-antitoxin system
VNPGMSPLLLDTNAAIWIMRHEPISRAALDAMNAARQSSTDVFVSPVTALEVGQLVSRNRVNLGATPNGWFGRLLAIPGMRLADLTPDLLIASSFLPGAPPRDPMDRILIATARELAATLVTRDREILAYGEQGNVRVVEC